MKSATWKNTVSKSRRSRQTVSRDEVDQPLTSSTLVRFLVLLAMVLKNGSYGWIKASLPQKSQSVVPDGIESQELALPFAVFTQFQLP